MPNRLWMSPMCQYSAPSCGPAMGTVTDWHVSHLEARAVGGAGLVTVEATAVDPVGRVSPADLGIWSDDHVPGLARLAQAISRHGSVPAIQLGHAGPKASTLPPWIDRRRRVAVADGGWIPWSPSPRPDGAEVHEPGAAELARVPELFAAAAARAHRAGFRVVEIHAAHGYLLHAFLSPATNARTDAYGVERSALLLDVVRAVRDRWPADLPLFVRISATDWLPQGLDLEDTVAVVRELLPLGVDLIDVSSGGLLPASIDARPGYQVPLAARIRHATGATVATVGLIEDAELVRRVLGGGDADAVFAGRALLRNPNWARSVLAASGEPEGPWPPQYAWAIGPRG